MPTTVLAPRPRESAPDRAASTRRTGFAALPEVRWAGLSLVFFLAALAAQFAGAPIWVWAIAYAVCYLTGGWEPAWAGIGALREKTLDVDLLMIVAAIGAAAIGQVLDGGLLIVIFATSGALEAIATQRTADSVRGLLDLAPATATRLDPTGGEETIEVDRLVVDDLVVVRPGERIPADGTVVGGASDVDTATITGEPLPVATHVGDRVFAGTQNGTGSLRVRVDRDSADSVIARIVAMVAEASETKAPSQLFIEKIEQRYSVGVVVATLLLFGIPLALGADLAASLLRAMTFMIVASPCAVMLATMPPLLATIANAGRHGVLIKSAVVAERLAEVNRVAFDKTGTLTEGSPRVAEVSPAAGHTADEVLALAAAAEEPSEHPLGRSVTAAARERGLLLAAAHDFSSTPGRGVAAEVDGRRVVVGSPARVLSPEDAAAGTEIQRLVASQETAGRTAVVVLVDGAAAGVLGIADSLRADAVDTVRAVTALTGRAPTLLTGDNPRAAATLAEAVGITDVRAGLLPEHKVAAVHELATGTSGAEAVSGDAVSDGAVQDGAAATRPGANRVLVVGDGVNDAPALAAAHTGIAMGGAGADLTMDAADAVIVRDELATVPTVLALARSARRLVMQNLVIAGVCITGLVVWDLVGTLPLPLGVAGHEGSTVLVGLNGLRLLTEAAWRRSKNTG